MVDEQFAQNFAQSWVKMWNSRDLDKILSYYTEDVIFHSPRIRIVMNSDADAVHGKAALREYWRHLKRYWDPRMRKQIIEHFRSGGVGLDELALQGVAALAKDDAGKSG